MEEGTGLLVPGSAMPFKTQQIEEPGINLTPMIDIVLLLVIFFMVGTQFANQETQYEIQLPTVTQAQPLTTLPDEIILNIAEDGQVVVSGQIRSPEEIESLLTAAHERYPQQVVIVRGDGHSLYQHAMTVLNLCNRAGISRIQLANRLESEGQ